MVSAERVSPTRGELLAIKRRIILSEKAYSVLKRKLDGLMFELMHRLGSARTAESALYENYVMANQELAVATMMVGELGVAIAAESIEAAPVLERTEKNVFGVRLPAFRVERVARSLDERGYSLLGTTPVIDDVVEAHEDLVLSIVAAAEAEASLRLLTQEIVRTRRRVRALENRVLPDLRETRDMIELRREELDIEEHARLFLNKKIRARRAEERSRTEQPTGTAGLPSGGRRAP
ncbi:MAG: V-type ATP synthase subunit D [Methanospirillum sp.]